MRIVIALGMSLLLSFSAAAQTVDGSIGADEYAWSQTKADATVWARLSADKATLFVAVRAPTAGWVSVGLGSPVMDGSFMLFGYVSGGVQTVTEETGKGRTHAINPKAIATVRVTEAGGFTTLEASVPAAGFIKGGKLDLIAAWGKRDDRVSLHAGRASFQTSF